MQSNCTRHLTQAIGHVIDLLQKWPMEINGFKIRLFFKNSFFPFDEVRSVTSFPSGGRDWSASIQQQRTISGFVFQKASLYSGELDTWEDSCSGVGRPYNQDVYYVANDMVNSQNNGPFTFTASGAQCFGLNSGRKWIGYRSRRLTAIWFSFLRRII